jgi:hypothetical protein
MASRLLFPSSAPSIAAPSPRKATRERENENSDRRFAASAATVGGTLNDQIGHRDFVTGETFWMHDRAFHPTGIGARVAVALTTDARG